MADTRPSTPWCRGGIGVTAGWQMRLPGFLCTIRLRAGENWLSRREFRPGAFRAFDGGPGRVRTTEAGPPRSGSRGPGTAQTERYSIIRRRPARHASRGDRVGSALHDFRPRTAAGRRELYDRFRPALSEAVSERRAFLDRRRR